VSAALPGGTVTFVFTDIEGSTELLKRLGDGYAAVAAEHRRLVRDAFGERGGQEVDTQGDAFFFCFGRAQDAVAAAVAAQRSLAGARWPGGVDVRVRMSLHTGEPVLGEEGYVGIDVVRAARICAAGHGGQVLLSASTAAIVAGRLPEGVAEVEVGEVRLKDIDTAERLFQLEIEGLQRQFPPLRTHGEDPLDFDARIERDVQQHVEQALARAFSTHPAASPPVPGVEATTIAKLAGVGLLTAAAALLVLAAAVALAVILARALF
jgi:class 3 adenylate cyclase